MTRKTATKTKLAHANQYLLDPRQLKCWEAYVDPKSLTFGNALQSAILAGYEEGHANKITAEKWWGEKVRRLNLVSKAERNLDQALDFPVMTQAMGMFGPIYEKEEVKVKVKLKNGKTKTKTRKVNGKAVMTFNHGLIGAKLEVSKFVAERLARKEWGNKENPSGNNVLVINISGQSVKRYGADVIAG